jgi:hypothetical protein
MHLQLEVSKSFGPPSIDGHLVDRARGIRVPTPLDDSHAHRKHRMSLLNDLLYYDDLTHSALAHGPIALLTVGDWDARRLVDKKDRRVF